MTVRTLIEALGAFDPNLPVRVTWEGIGRHINAKHLWENGGTLFVDADENCYKPEKS